MTHDPRIDGLGEMAVLPVMACEPEYGPALRERIVPLITGIGPVEAAIALTAMLSRLEAANAMPDVIVALGSSGSRTLRHAVVYQVSEVGYRDMDASPLGFAKGVTPMLGQPAVLPLPCPVADIPIARLSTGANVVSGAVYDAIDADMVDMETWALVRVAQTFGVPLVALRGVSDGRSELQALDDWTGVLDQIDRNLAFAWDRLTETLARDGLTALARVPAAGLDPDAFAAQHAAPSPPASDLET